MISNARTQEMKSITATSRLSKYIKTIHHLEATFCLVALCVIVVSMSLAVIFRYVFFSPLIWPGDVSTLALVWLTFIGAGHVYAEGGHVAATGIVRTLPLKLRRATALAVTFAILTVAVITGAFAYNTFLIQREQFITTLGVSRGLYSLPVIWMSFSIVLTVLSTLLQTIQGQE